MERYLHAVPCPGPCDRHPTVVPYVGPDNEWHALVRARQLVAGFAAAEAVVDAGVVQLHRHPHQQLHLPAAAELKLLLGLEEAEGEGASKDEPLVDQHAKGALDVDAGAALLEVEGVGVGEERHQRAHTGQRREATSPQISP